MNLKKSFICIFTISALLITSCLPSNSVSAKSKDTTYAVRAAYVSDVNSNGTNLISDTQTKNQKIVDLSDSVLINQNNSSLDISFNYEGSQVIITSSASAVNENHNVVYYEAASSNTDFEVKNLTLQKNINDSAIYFQDYYSKNTQYNTILKLYLRANTGTRDYLMIEVFGFELLNYDQIVASVASNEMPLGWYTEDFEPIKTESVITPYLLAQDTFTRTETFQYLAFKETHTLKYKLVLDSVDTIFKGTDGNCKARITVLGKTTTCPESPNLNSSDSSALYISGLSLTGSTPPNTAMFTSKIDGSVSSISGADPGSLSASIGVSLGLLSLSYSVSPSSFTTVKTVDLDDTFFGYVNGVSGQYTRFADVKMNSSYSLIFPNNYFEVLYTIRDYGKVNSYGYFYTYFNITFSNINTKQTYSVEQKRLSTAITIK
jgi:hypothetical protein